MSDSQHIPDEQLQLLGDLRRLVDEQVTLSRRGNISDVERLFPQASALVARIVDSGILHSPELRDERAQLQKLYEELHLTVTAQRAKTSDELSHIRIGKKTMSAYRSSLSTTNEKGG
jgi:hypothetical protein